MSALPNDSDISAGLPGSAQSKSTPHHSPLSPRSPSVLYAHPTSADQAAQDLENAAAFQQAQDLIHPDSGDTSSISDTGYTSSVSDAGYETDSIGTTTDSLSSSVRDYVFENGRRYHRFRDGAYNFPNDDAEQDREDMKHAMMVTLCQQLHFAPIGEKPQNILDMGTGTGIWAIESEIAFHTDRGIGRLADSLFSVGDQYPSATVNGVDLSPIQPSWVPPNVKFTVDDLESPWLKPENYFDYVHGRHIVMAIKNWPKLMQRALL